MKFKKSTFAALAAIAALALSACSSSAESEGTKEDAPAEKIIIRASWVPTTHSTHWATASKYLEDENIEIQLSPFKTDNEQQVAMQGGSLDMMTMGYNNTITALDRGEIKYKYVSGVSEGGTRILVREGVDINSWDDVKGKTVGAAQGGNQYQQLVVAAAQHGIDIAKDTEFVNIGSAPDMILALMNGDVDLVSVWEPSASEGISRGYAHEVPGISDTFYEDAWRVNSGLAVSNEFLEAHPEAVDAVVEALKKAEAAINADEDLWIEEFMKLSSSDPEILKKSIQNLDAVTELKPDAIKNIAKKLYEAGIVSTDQSGNIDDYIAVSGS